MCTSSFAKPIVALLLVLPHAPRAENLATFTWLTVTEQSPYGAYNPWRENWLAEGRVHSNDRLGVSPFGLPSFLGLVSQAGADIINLSPPEFESVFSGGLLLAHDPVDFSFPGLVEGLRAVCAPSHHWLARLDSLDLTTLIRFDGPMYHAAQYAPAQSVGTDTAWVVPWATYALPQPPDEAPLIWIEGVGRLKGIVQGRVTVLGSDSLYIMGDLITADTDTISCGDADLFGMAPAGSTNGIGLIGEKDILIAATLENGFANGGLSSVVTCGFPNHPVVTGCGQGRRDVIITASVLALGCSFGAELWQTTAWDASCPTPSPQACGGESFTHFMMWDDSPGGSWPDCPGADRDDDRRGSLWLSGSLVSRHRGLLSAIYTNAFGGARIGYTNLSLREDPNLAIDPPPFWPDVQWDPLLSTWLVAGPHSACGATVAAEDFIQDWESGELRLEVTNQDWDFMDSLAVRTWINGQLVAREAFPEPGDFAPLTWTPSLDIRPWLTQPCEIHIDVTSTDWAMNEDGEWVAVRPDAPFWNEGGAECAWSVQPFSAVIPETPAVFVLSPPWPNPFNPVTHVELTLPSAGHVRLEVFDLAGRREAVIHDGSIPAGAHAFTLDGSAWPAGLHLLRVTHDGGVETRKLLLLR